MKKRKPPLRMKVGIMLTKRQAWRKVAIITGLKAKDIKSFHYNRVTGIALTLR